MSDTNNIPYHKKYYHDNNEVQKKHKLYHYYKRKYKNIPPSVIEEYKFQLPLLIKLIKLKKEIDKEDPLLFNKMITVNIEL